MSLAPETRTTLRLAALRDLAIMDTEPEPEFDDLVEIAAAICGVPTGSISLLDERRQWFKSIVGTTLKETSLAESICRHTIEGDVLMIVEDARCDARFRENPAVQQDPGPRFYAGVPIYGPSAVPVGTLCVWDSAPRSLDQAQITALRVLARQVDARLELRGKRRELEQTLAETERVKQALAASEQMFQSFMNSGPFHSFMKTADGVFLYYNQPLAQHFGVSLTEMIGRRDSDLWPAEMVAQYRAHDLQVLRSGQTSVQEEDVLDAAGRLCRFRTYKFPCLRADGELAVGGISMDVTREMEQTRALERSERELRNANLRLVQLAHTDPLTLLPNRRAFEEKLKFLWSLAQRKERPLTVLLLDIDNFKQCNDAFGHGHGDAVLRQLAALGRKAVRDHDVFARYGGEEFALLLPETTEAEARALVERLLRNVRGATWEHAPVTISLGLACSFDGAQSQDELLRWADEALYAAKQTGKDKAVSYQEHREHVTRAIAESPFGAAHRRADGPRPHAA